MIKIGCITGRVLIFIDNRMQPIVLLRDREANVIRDSLSIKRRVTPKGTFQWDIELTKRNLLCIMDKIYLYE